MGSIIGCLLLGKYFFLLPQGPKQVVGDLKKMLLYFTDDYKIQEINVVS